MNKATQALQCGVYVRKGKSKTNERRDKVMLHKKTVYWQEVNSK